MNSENRDYLTGLYSRKELYHIYENVPADSSFHFMFMDVDNFKNVNDVYGHNEGDLLLKATAAILKSCAPEARIIRLGGDEFVLLFVGEYTREYLCSIASNIIERISHKEGFSHISTFISASIGILYDEKSSGTLDDILLKSDMAMYYAKSHGKSNYVVFNDIAAQVFMEVAMEKHQQAALDSGEFEIRYLPVISAQTSKLRLSQVRLFWHMPDGSTKQQSEFLPLFEKNGFIRPLSRWVFEQVLSHLSAYHRTAGQKGKIGLYTSRLLLLNADFPQQLMSLLSKYDISPDELDLELDESAFIRGSANMLPVISQLKEMGFGVSIAGVGSAFASIAYWDKIHFNSIMFDPAYLKEALASSRGRQIVKTLLAMGRELKMQVLADGISTREDALFLSGCGCNAISGSYYSEALPLNSYFAYVKDKIAQGNEKTEFRFKNSLSSADKKHKGQVLGHGIKYTRGISRNWSALLFPGGGFSENVVELPAALLADSSYTVCMWLKPLKNNSWTSSFYARYQGSFCAFSPFIVGGNSVFRISEDTDINGFHDALARQIPEDTWTFVCFTYDDLLEVSKTYINGRKAGHCFNVPSLPACRQILLGGDPFQPSYRGYLSGLVLYGEVKSEDEIMELYQKFCREPEFCGKMESFWM